MMQNIRLAVFTDEHLKLMSKWLQQAHVRPWYPLPEEDIESAKALCTKSTNDSTSDAGHHLIMAGELPIGYLRWQLVPKAVLNEIGLTNIPDNSADVDLFIGETSNICKGAGGETLAAIEALLRARGDVPLIGLTTNKENHYAHKAFEKSGYVISGEYSPDEYGECYLYTKHLK